jgi:fumarylacetoacetase
MDVICVQGKYLLPFSFSDLCGTGTISGPTENSFGSLLELSWNGQKPLVLDDATTRTFIEDGDSITINGYCQGKDFKIGFGSCTGKILPARK